MSGDKINRQSALTSEFVVVLCKSSRIKQTHTHTIFTLLIRITTWEISTTLYNCRPSIMWRRRKWVHDSCWLFIALVAELQMGINLLHYFSNLLILALRGGEHSSYSPADGFCIPHRLESWQPSNTHLLLTDICASTHLCAGRRTGRFEWWTLSIAQSKKY